MNYSKAKFLFEIINPYRKFAMLLILFSMLASGFDGISIGLLVPLMSNLQKMEETDDLPKVFQWVAELLSHYPGHQQIVMAIVFVLMAIIFKNLFSAVSIKLGYWLSTRLVADLRMRAIRLLLGVGIEFHYKSKAGDLIEKVINNTGNVEFIVKSGIEWIANALTFISLFSMLFLLSWQLTFITTVLGLAFMLIIFQYTKSFRKIGQKSAITGQALMTFLHQTLDGILLIKSYSKEQDQISILNEKINAHSKTEYRRNFKVFTINPITDVLGSVAIGILFVVAMVMYKMNIKLMLAQLLPFMYILLRIVPLVKFLHSQRGEIVSRLPYVDLVYNLLRQDNKPFIQNGDRIFNTLTHEIQFKSVTFSYHSGNGPVLRDISFSLPAGKTTAIVGNSGAGKSTITSLMLRLYDAQKGEILIDGEPLQNFRVESFHSKIGIVTQDTFLFNDTVKFNILFGSAKVQSDESIIQAAKKAGAHKFIMALPNGYETTIGDRGVRLSGGQRQRLAIARAIIREPEILILDEATSSLDTLTERRIHKAIRELSHGRTVIIIAHRLSTIQGVDQIIVLKNGRVVEIGEEQTLLAKEGEYYKLARIHE